jgi:hypothetical protein
VQAGKEEAVRLLLAYEFIVYVSVSGPAAPAPAPAIDAEQDQDGHIASNSSSGRKKRRRSSGSNNTTNNNNNNNTSSSSSSSSSSDGGGGGGRYLATPLGKATALSGLSPLAAVPVLLSLQAARARLVLRAGLHAVFLATPPDTRLPPRWAAFEGLLAVLGRDYPDTGPALDALGVQGQELHALSRSPPPPACRSDRVLFYRRLYSAVLLFVLIQEVPLTKVADFAELNRGQVQQLQKEASMFCGMVSAMLCYAVLCYAIMLYYMLYYAILYCNLLPSIYPLLYIYSIPTPQAVSFCRKLHWDALGGVLQGLCGRLGYGVAEELLPLVRLGAQVGCRRRRRRCRC